MSVVIETTEGDITVDLYTKERPKCSYNFLKLCKLKYYNCCLFHKIEKDFIVQTGDPTGSGRGGDSIYFQMYGEQGRFFERERKPRLKHEKFGTISMVNNGEDLHGSQFFITLGENLDYLDADHTVFGEVVEGLDIVVKLNAEICDDGHRPYRDIRITHTVILDDPFDDPKDVELPDRSPEPGREVFESNRIGVEEDVNDNDGKTEAEVDEDMADKEAKARATILEMIGDIPDADVKPPENVLFICKLNPVTRDEDLEIIFSRFGTILSCEVIRDAKSGESLQYAFIEFENEADCEKAYFKMDNVLIDDRRIHVDFSQSVSKIKWKGKGKGVVHVQEDDDNRSSKQKDSKNSDRDSNSRQRRDQPRENHNHHSRQADKRSWSPQRPRERRRERSRSREHSRNERKRQRSSSRDRGQRDNRSRPRKEDVPRRDNNHTSSHRVKRRSRSR